VCCNADSSTSECSEDSGFGGVESKRLVDLRYDQSIRCVGMGSTRLERENVYSGVVTGQERLGRATIIFVISTPSKTICTLSSGRGYSVRYSDITTTERRIITTHQVGNFVRSCHEVAVVIPIKVIIIALPNGNYGRRERSLNWI
jgi:hypothetical protein